MPLLSALQTNFPKAVRATITTALMMAFVLCCGAARSSADQSISEKDLVIGTKETPPFVMKRSDGTLYGISIDLWHRIAEQLHLRYRFS
jgi:polar amino acid transport system substrate-binding protein